MPERADDHRSGAQAVERACAVLRCFESGDAELRVSELATRTGLSVSTTHRLVRALCGAGVLLQNPVTDRYGLGPALVVLGRRAEQSLGYDRAVPALRALAESTGESVNLGIRAGADVLVVLDVPSSSPLRFAQPAGTRVPIHSSAMGKCLLAYAGALEREVDALPDLARLTDRTITERDRLVAELEAVRARGWALNDEERIAGVRAVAAPVLAGDGTAVAAVVVQAPTVRVGDGRLEELVVPLLQTARDLAPVLVTARS